MERDNETPLAAASVSLIIQYNEWSGQGLDRVVSDEKGEFRFEHLIPGVLYTLSVQPKGAGGSQRPQQSTVIQSTVMLRTGENLRMIPGLNLSDQFTSG